MEYTAKQIKEDKKISTAIMSSVAILTIQYFILVFFNLMGTEAGSIVQLTFKGLVGLLYLIALPSVLKRNRLKFMATYFMAIFIFIFNYAIFGENWIYLKTIVFPLFFTCLPSLIYAYSIENWDILKETMKKVSNIVFVVGTLIGILVFTGSSTVGSYSMSLSYYILLPAIMFMDEFVDKKTIKSGIKLTVAMIVILALGSRGAVMCFGVFIILKLIKRIKNITSAKAMLYIILFSLVILGIMLFDEILGIINETLISYGIHSRTLALFLQGGVYLSGRDTLYEDVFNEILNKPFLGIGLAGDRLIIGGGYVHNIFLEILANFGFILGGFLIVFLIFLLVRNLLERDIRRYNMAIVWIGLGFVPLLVSGSYLTDFNFWIMLGILTRELKVNLREN